MSVLASVAQVIVVVVLGLVLSGLMAKVRARAEGRVGAPVLQPVREVLKLWARQSPRPSSASAFFALAPRLNLLVALAAAGLVPSLTTRASSASSADALVVVFLLLTGTLVSALAGLDTATAFGGMGASRAVTLSALSEPALLVGLAAFAVPGGSLNLAILVARSGASPSSLASPAHVLAGLGLLVIVLAEAGRLPVDNPSTHLELTMIHEAMVLEYGGRDLALVKLGAATRVGVLVSLLGVLVVPWGVAHTWSPAALAGALGLAVAKALVVGLGIALIEVHSAKLRLFRVPELLAGAFVLGALGVMAALVVR